MIPRFVVLLAAMTLAVGCSWMPWKGGSERAVKDDGRTWQPQPIIMRVYPTTRIAPHAQGPVVEARIEMIDALADTTKGVGNFHFELAPVEHLGQTDTGQRLYTWDTEVRTLAQQREHFDPISRTYHFRLAMDAVPAATSKLRFVATFSPVEGQRLDAETLLTVE